MKNIRICYDMQSCRGILIEAAIWYQWIDNTGRDRMTDYTYYEGEIRTGNTMVGWMGKNFPNPFDCLVSVKNILKSHGHSLKVEVFKNDFEIVPAEPYIREVSGGVYISDRIDDLNYAFFSDKMNCSKLCVKAVLKIFKDARS